MARKNLLSGLMPPPADVVSTPSPDRSPDRPGPRGAVGAVSRSFADLKARALVDLDPHLIDAGGLQDRLEHDAAEDEVLRQSIAEHGQQVPVLVRPHPEAEGRFQIVYGRRRVLALRDLGRPVKALVRDLDDRAMLIAQGTENTARRDLSFIEKANFARQMSEAGYDRKTICDAISVDKTVISRMLSVAERVPLAVIERIGSAPGIGRDRWLAVAERIAQGGYDSGWLLDIMTAYAAEGGPDSRFHALEAALDGAARRRAAPKSRPPRQAVIGDAGKPLGSARATPRALVLRLDRSRAQGFEDWLLDRLPEIHRDWLARRED